jgi:hypothetical protein
MDEKNPHEPEVSLRGADPRLPFYITAGLNLDGSLDISSEGKDPLSLDAAIEHAMEFVKEHGDEQFVIECRAVKKVIFRRPRVESVKTKACR